MTMTEAIRSISPKEIVDGAYAGESTAWFSLREPQAKHPGGLPKNACPDLRRSTGDGPVARTQPVVHGTPAR
ncbi:hypothetical protein [Kitasatospora sp. NPDC057015]|uniref:hypothetical protein n=1 Tax=Kitasatospora sp. NPDC057015 TaxID=3346001 RepID=UPI00363DA16A